MAVMEGLHAARMDKVRTETHRAVTTTHRAVHPQAAHQQATDSDVALVAGRILLKIPKNFRSADIRT